MVIDVDTYLKDEGPKCRDCGSKPTWMILVGGQWSEKFQRLTRGQYIPFCDACSKKYEMQISRL